MHRTHIDRPHIWDTLSHLFKALLAVAVLMALALAVGGLLISLGAG